MDSVSLVSSSNVQSRNNTMEDLKNNITNAVTLTGTTSVVMGASEILTLVLLITGIVFNVVRIYEMRQKKKKNQ